MIFYFSGTGNSLQVARSIAEHTGEKLVSIAGEMNKQCNSMEYTLTQDERIGFVYPTYAWAPPGMVLQFIKKLRVNNYDGNYVFLVVTCGDEAGKTMEVFTDSLHEKGLPLHSGFSVIMPNNYVIMFDVDSKELEMKKLSAAEITMEKINKIVAQREKGIFEVNKGMFPNILTHVIRPIANKLLHDPRRFYADEKCTGCGLCQKLCNCGNIEVCGKPRWGKHCSQCLACLHYCAVKAAQYGKGTARKGRYTNPNVSVDDMCL